MTIVGDNLDQPPLYIFDDDDLAKPKKAKKKKKEEEENTDAGKTENAEEESPKGKEAEDE